MRYVVGIDPDLHNTAVAVLIGGKPIFASTVSISKSLKGWKAAQAMAEALPNFFDTEFWTGIGLPMHTVCDALIIERQQIYTGHGKSRPDDLLKLAFVSGAAAAAAIPAIMPAKIYTPSPREWKGNVPKPVHQARICEKLGWSYKKTQGYSYPTKHNFDPVEQLACLEPSQWKHVMDAIGLGLWWIKKKQKS